MPNVIKEGDVEQGHNGPHLQVGGSGDTFIRSGLVNNFLRRVFSLCLGRILVPVQCQKGTHLQVGGAFIQREERIFQIT